MILRYAVSYTHLDVYKRQRLDEHTMSPCCLAVFIRSVSVAVRVVVLCIGGV